MVFSEKIIVIGKIIFRVRSQVLCLQILTEYQIQLK